MFVANTVIKPSSTEISFNGKFNVTAAINAETKKDCEKISLSLKGYGFAILEAEF